MMKITRSGLIGAVLAVVVAGAAAAEMRRDLTADAGGELDSLFEALAAAPNVTVAIHIEAKIRKRWIAAGGPTLALITSRALDAILKKDYDHALDLIETAIALDPDYAEAWNQRATIHYLRDNYGQALVDLERTLALEPRHFGALADLGQVFRDLGDKPRALAAFRAALKLNPNMKKVREAADKLAPEVDGREL